MPRIWSFGAPLAGVSCRNLANSFGSSRPLSSASKSAIGGTPWATTAAAPSDSSSATHLLRSIMREP